MSDNDSLVYLHGKFISCIGGCETGKTWADIFLDLYISN